MKPWTTGSFVEDPFRKKTFDFEFALKTEIFTKNPSLVGLDYIGSTVGKCMFKEKKLPEVQIKSKYLFADCVNCQESPPQN